MKSGGDFDYDQHGSGYDAHRRADPRIAEHIERALGDARTVLNVGAGAGSYEPKGRYVLALEPSAVMRAQRPPTAVPAIRAYAEAPPFDDRSVDAVMAAMTVHQWSDLTAGLAELRRVSRGPVVVVTGHGPALARYWVNDYAPELTAAEQPRLPLISSIVAGVGINPQVSAIPIPIDCTDGMMEAFYARPERLLDAQVRAAQSSWSFIEPRLQQQFVENLSADLASGQWDARYGSWRRMETYNGSLRLVLGYSGR
jgi:hypothetical protein